MPEETGQEEISPKTRGGREGCIRSIGEARREASATYWAWKKSTRKISPHEMAIVISALSNIAGMIEKENNNRVKELEEKVEQLEKAQAEQEPKSSPRPVLTIV